MKHDPLLSPFRSALALVLRLWAGFLVVLAGPLAAQILTTVDSIGNTGRYPSLQLNGGNPVISYYDSNTFDLKLATCTANCASVTPTWQIVTVDSVGDVGLFTSLRLNGSNPIISYFDNTNAALKLATCTANCATATPTWQIVTVDSAGSVGRDTSLQLNGGNPVISYYDITNGDLKLATCTVDCATATPTWQIVTVDSAGTIGRYSSLQLNGGNPVISYYDNNNANLKLATCTANCASATPTWQIVTVDSGGNVGEFTSLQLNGGNPVISYYDDLNGDLKLATCTANCATATPTWQMVTVDSGGDVGQYTSLQLSGGNAVISYYDFTNQDLRLALCTANCATATPTWQIVTIDSAGSVGADTSLQLHGANPVISYFDPGNSDLKLATLSLPGVTSVAAPAPANYTTGQTLDFTVNWSEAIAVTGSPQLSLTIGASSVNAAYLSGSGSSALVFRYTVQAGDSDNDGITVGSLNLNGGTLSGIGVPAVLTLNSVGATTGVLVNLAYTVTPSAGANGSITPSTAQSITAGGSVVFTVTPSPGYLVTVGGTCGGTLVGNTYTTNAVTAACTVVASFTLVPVTTFTAPSATGSGTISASFTGGGAGCTFQATPQYIPVAGHPRSPPAGTAPAGVVFPHGLFDFTTTGCTAGSTITMTITYPTALPAGTQYWKYGPTPADPVPHWYVLPASISGTTATFTITDGQLGDDDLAANGTIVDQGGPGGGAGGGVGSVPTLSEWALLLLGGLMLAFALRGTRRGKIAD